MNTTARQALSFAAATFAVGTFAFALALVLGGGAPPPPPPGLSGPGRVPAWLGDLAAFVARVLGVVTVGLGTLGSRPFGRERLHAPAAVMAAMWAATSVLQLGLLAWELDGRAGLFDTSNGTALVLQGVFAAVATAGWTVPAHAPGRSLAWLAGIAALLPAVLAGHPRSAEHPWVAGVSVSMHVIAAAVWVGGLVALAWVALRDADWHSVVPGYSNVAVVCAAAVAVSGVIAALGRIGLGDVFTSKYGALIALKAVALAGLVGAGWLQRRRVAGRWRGFVGLAAMELVTMSLTFALAVALTRTPPPA